MKPFALLSILVFSLATFTQEKPNAEARKPAASTLKIVKDALVKDGTFYSVKGSIYNPNDDGEERSHQILHLEKVHGESLPPPIFKLNHYQ